MAEWFDSIPTDTIKNLRWREELHRTCQFSEKWRRNVTACCRDDVLFFFAGLSWLFEPRPKIVKGEKMPKIIPMIPWPHQVTAIREIHEHLGHTDVGVEKSRGEGMSWIGVLFACHSFEFDEYSKVGLVSRTESAADDPDDTDSLGWKIDWELEQLPPWLVGEKGKDFTRNRNKHTWVNKKNGASISAGAATGDVFRGGRLTWALMDEFAFFKKGEDVDALNSSHGATNSRLFVSTVNGQHNEYYRLMHEPSNMVKVVIDWKQNISRNRGLYTIQKGKPVAVDPKNNPLPPHYDPPDARVRDLFSRLRSKGFEVEKSKLRGEARQRSPWYDHECDRAGMTPQRIAQELDRDYAGSSFLIFGHEFMAAVHETSRQPVHTGNFVVNHRVEEGEMKLECEFQELRGGPVDLWLPLSAHGKPPKGIYALSADISSGLGGSHTSNSSIVGTDLTSHEQILGFAANTIEPSDFADLNVAIAYWLFDAYLGWEANGQQGGAFTKRVINLRYPNVYHRRNHRKGTRTKTKDLGWWTDDNTKGIMFSEMIRAVRAGDYTVRDPKLVDEFSQYVNINGKIEHAGSLMTDDESSKGKAHGDRVIALGVGCQLVLDRPDAFVYAANKHGGGDPKKNPPMGTMAYRMQQYAIEDAENRRTPDGWFGSVLDR